MHIVKQKELVFFSDCNWQNLTRLIRFFKDLFCDESVLKQVLQMLGVLFSLFGLLVHLEHQLRRVCVRVVTYDTEKVFGSFEGIVELVSFTLKD